MFHGTAKEADARLAVLQIKFADSKDGSITIDEFFYGVLIPECETRIENDDFTEQTLNEYLSRYKTYIQKPFGKTRLDSLKAKDVQDWLMTLTKGAAKQAKTLLKLIMRRAEDLDYIEYHPMNKRYIMPQKTCGYERTKDRYSEEELIDIFEKCQGQWWESAYIMAAFGGGLPSEVGGVMTNEVTFDKTESGLFTVIPINRTVHDRRGGSVLVTDRAKNEHRKADLIVMPPYSSRLKSLVRAAKLSGEDFLMEDGFGSPVKPSVVSAAFKSWIAKQPIRYIPFGNLRNAYSTMMHAHGVSDDMVRKLMRHSSKSNVDYTNYNRPEPAEFERVISDAFRNIWEEDL